MKNYSIKLFGILLLLPLLTISSCEKEETALSLLCEATERDKVQVSISPSFQTVKANSNSPDTDVQNMTLYFIISKHYCDETTGGVFEEELLTLSDGYAYTKKTYTFNLENKDDYIHMRVFGGDYDGDDRRFSFTKDYYYDDLIHLNNQTLYKVYTVVLGW